MPDTQRFVELVASLRDRLVRYAAGDTDAVLDPTISSELDELGSALRAAATDAVPLPVALVLAQTYLARFQVLPEGEGSDLEALESSLSWYERVQALAPEQVPAEIRELLELGVEDPGPTGQTTDPVQLPDAELTATIAELTASADETGTTLVLANLCACLTERYERSADEDDIARAINAGAQAVRLNSGGEEVRRIARLNLAVARTHAFESTGEQSLIDDAIRDLQSLMTEWTEQGILANLSAAFTARFESYGVEEDLSRAVDFARRAAAATGSEDPWRAAALANLGGILLLAHEEGRGGPTLDEAIAVGEEAVEISDETDQAYPKRLSNLAMSYSVRYDLSGSRADLDRAVELGRESVELPGDSLYRAGRLSSLALHLRTRGSRYGRPDDLRESLQISARAAAITPAGRADRAGPLSNAAGTAMVWYDWTGDEVALDLAVRLGEQSVASASGSRLVPTLLTNLAMVLLTRFEVRGEATDLEQACRCAQDAVSAAVRPVNHVLCSNLSVVLRNRFEQGGEDADLRGALTWARRAVAAVPQDHAGAASYYANLALCLWMAGHHEEALLSARRACDGEPATNAPGAAYRANLARMLDQGDEEQRREAARLWDLIADCRQAPSALQLEAAVISARAIAGVRLGDPLASRRYRRSLDLIPEVAWHGIDPVSRLHRLGPVDGLASEAAAVELAASEPGRALVLLEGTRSNILSLELGRTGLAGLQRAKPRLARRLQDLRRARSRLPLPAWVETL